jgi:hypothetical protein
MRYVIECLVFQDGPFSPSEGRDMFLALACFVVALEANQTAAVIIRESG